MKKGCFLKIIIVLTIVIAAITYIIQNRFNDFLLEPSKKLLVPIFAENFEESIKHIKNSKQKDSLIILVRNYINNIKNVKSFSEDSLKDFISNIRYFSTDSTITNDELDRINKFIIGRSSNERSKED